VADDATSPLHVLITTKHLRSQATNFDQAAAFAKPVHPLQQAKAEAGIEPTGLPRLRDRIPYESCATHSAILGVAMEFEGEDQDEP
jgi:hypothetical protein